MLPSLKAPPPAGPAAPRAPRGGMSKVAKAHELMSRWALLVFVTWIFSVLAAAPAQAGEVGRPHGRLVDPAWLQQHLAEVLVLDASVTPQHLAGHIPGAVSADLYRYGPSEPTQAAMEQRLQSWGVSPGRPIVVYDQGGDYMAPRLFYDLYYRGVPVNDLYLLDGGLARWRAQGGAVTKEPTPAPPAGSFRITQQREEVRSRLPEFLAATGDRASHAVVEALDPEYHYGVKKFFDRAGHVPNAVLMPSVDFFNADKTFKSADEIRRLARHAGLRPEQVVHSHCGGGVAAAVPWFALHFVADRPQVKLYLESQHGWLRDERGLPYWTYGEQAILRDATWVNGWNAPMMRAFGVARLNIVDVRPTARYALGHVPYALNIEAATFRRHLGHPGRLAEALGSGGVNPTDEVVLVTDRGLTPDAALAFLALTQLGHAKVSLLMDSVDEWGLRGFELTKQPTLVGKPQSPKEQAVPPAAYAPQPRTGVLVTDPAATRGEFPKVFVAMGQRAQASPPAGAPVIALPYTELLTNEGQPKPAPELWTLISKAGVPRQAEVILFADDVAEAAVGYVIFRLMGWPDVKVWLTGGA